ncbi:MAG: hypothetical protein JNL65_12550 [Saprospiraceae bacterium]|nr:hypothetical protein [Saprospiraceae bacterium]
MEIDKLLFIKGFNHGFILAIYEDKLLKLLLNKPDDHFNSYESGLMAGMLQLEMENLKLKRIEKREFERD